MGVFPSDHVIGKPARYRQLVKRGFRAAEAGNIAVLGIQPRWAETGYGYIEFPDGVKPGARRPFPFYVFARSPMPKTAAQFVAAGRFYWNAGMFFWRADVLLEAMRQHLPKTASRHCGLPASRDPGSLRRNCRQTFPKCENISIDYAVLERADTSSASPATISAGTMWEAGTPSTSCCLTMRTAMPPFAGDLARIAAATMSMPATSWSRCSAWRTDHRGYARRAADCRPETGAAGGEIVKVLEKVKRDDLL